MPGPQPPRDHRARKECARDGQPQGFEILSEGFLHVALVAHFSEVYYLRKMCQNGLMKQVYLLFTVTPGQSSVRNGTAGKPAALVRFALGLLAHA